MPDVLITYFPYLLKATVNTIYMAILSISAGLILGVVCGILSVVGNKPVKALIVAYVFAIRGTPPLIQIFIFYFLFPRIGISIPPFFAAVTALTFYSGAFVSEIIRGAILSIPIGQTEAAKAIGMGKWMRMRKIILPQAFRYSIPPLVNNSVGSVKVTAYASIINVWELTYAAREVFQRTVAAFEIFSGAMLIYFMLCYPLTILAARLEKKVTYVH